MKTKYWVIVASKDHVKTGVLEGVVQACHGKSAPLKRMSKGDFVVFYSSKQTMGGSEKCQKFTAIGKVKDDDVYSFEMTADFCPFRRNIDFIDSVDISIVPLIDDLGFILNKRSWGYPFRYGFFEISYNDFCLISSKMIKKENAE